MIDHVGCVRLRRGSIGIVGVWFDYDWHYSVFTLFLLRLFFSFLSVEVILLGFALFGLLNQGFHSPASFSMKVHGRLWGCEPNLPTLRFGPISL